MQNSSRILLGFLFTLVAANLPLFANAQTRAAAGVLPGSIYPGAVLVLPQREDYKAPAIYRSREPVARLEGLMAIQEICRDDTAALMKNRRFERRATPVSGWASSMMVSAEVAASLDFVQQANLKAGAKYEYLAKIKTGPMQVWDSGDDDIGTTVIRYVSKECKKIIRKRVVNGHIVFVAAEAVQAQEYEVQLERHAAGSLTGGGCWGFWCPKVEIVGKYDETSQRSGPGKSVTIALVPAEMSRERFVTLADLDSLSPPIVPARGRAAKLKVAANALPELFPKTRKSLAEITRARSSVAEAAIMVRAD